MCGGAPQRQPAGGDGHGGLRGGGGIAGCCGCCGCCCADGACPPCARSAPRRWPAACARIRSSLLSTVSIVLDTRLGRTPPAPPLLVYVRTEVVPSGRMTRSVTVTVAPPPPSPTAPWSPPRLSAPKPPSSPPKPMPSSIVAWDPRPRRPGPTSKPTPMPMSAADMPPKKARKISSAAAKLNSECRMGGRLPLTWRRPPLAKPVGSGNGPNGPSLRGGLFERRLVLPTPGLNRVANGLAPANGHSPGAHVPPQSGHSMGARGCCGCQR